VLYRTAIFWTILLCLFGPFVQAQDQAQIRLDSNLAETGVPFMTHLSVSATHGKPGLLDLSPWAPAIQEKNILSKSDWRLESGQWVMDVQLLLFDADTLQLSPLLVPTAQGDSLYTNALQLTILATPAPEELKDMADIKDIYREKAVWTDYWPWMLGGFLVLLLLGILQWLASRKNNKGAASRYIELPPHELALKKLAVLQQKQLWQQGELKSYYAEITHIIREFLEKRFQIPALESTSHETIQYLRKQTEFPIHLLHGLNEVLQQADMVKFAKGAPADSFHPVAMDRAVLLVNECTPLPTPLEKTSRS
jgi:hypothetical protein